MRPSNKSTLVEIAAAVVKIRDLAKPFATGEKGAQGQGGGGTSAYHVWRTEFMKTPAYTAITKKEARQEAMKNAWKKIKADPQRMANYGKEANVQRAATGKRMRTE